MEKELNPDKPSNSERQIWIKQELRAAGLKAVVCALPSNVLMLSGYWPVIGASMAVATEDGMIGLLVPEDERELANNSWASVIEPYEPSSLNRKTNLEANATAALSRVLSLLTVRQGEIGFEAGPLSEPASYVGMTLFGETIRDVIRGAKPNCDPVPADAVLARLTSVKTPAEVAAIRRSCALAQYAFEQGCDSMQAGMTEAEVSAEFHRFLVTAPGATGFKRSGGSIFCMSGPNSARAYAAYAQTRHRVLEYGDVVMIHCNSYADGYWTDITRVYSIGEPSPTVLNAWDAVLEARSLAVSTIRASVPAREVDAAARNWLESRKLGSAFRHSTGHGVGFAAISANSRPQIHPLSDDILEVGMTFNVEPAVYFENSFGIRHCDMVAVTSEYMELLTPFQLDPEECILD